jgi:hypothetical protein
MSKTLKPFSQNFTTIAYGVGQNGQISFLKNGKEHCGYIVCGSKNFFVPFEKYEPNIQHTL